jgi:hypothetical protein
MNMVQKQKPSHLKKGEAKITTLEKWLKGNGFIGDPFQTRGQNADWSDRDAQSNL